MDNAFIERLGPSLKNGCVYLHACDRMSAERLRATLL